MKVLVDTSIWSLAFRHNKTRIGNHSALELQFLIEEMRVQMIGPIRQEILSGIRVVSQFETLKQHLRSFPDLPLNTETYEKGAEFFNLCRAKGIQGSNTDFLICAVAEQNRFPIFTIDKDFQLFAKHLPIQLHTARTT